MNTVRHLEFLRDRNYPSSLRTIFRREVILSSYSERSLENARRAKDDLFGIQNTRKARLGGLAGLQDPEIMQKKQAEEKALREAVAKNPDLKNYSGAWDEVSKAIEQWEKIYDEWGLLENGQCV